MRAIATLIEQICLIVVMRVEWQTGLPHGQDAKRAIEVGIHKIKPALRRSTLRRLHVDGRNIDLRA